MLNSHVALRRLAVTAACVALAVVATGLTGCSTQTKAAAPTTVAVVAIGAPPGTQAAAATSGMHGNTPAPAAKVASLPSMGKDIVQKSCLKAGCHTDKLLGERAKSPQAKSILAKMYAKVKLTTDQQTAVTAYFTQ